MRVSPCGAMRAAFSVGTGGVSFLPRHSVASGQLSQATGKRVGESAVLEVQGFYRVLPEPIADGLHRNI